MKTSQSTYTSQSSHTHQFEVQFVGERFALLSIGSHIDALVRGDLVGAPDGGGVVVEERLVVGSKDDGGHGGGGEEKMVVVGGQEAE